MRMFVICMRLRGKRGRFDDKAITYQLVKRRGYGVNQNTLSCTPHKAIIVVLRLSGIISCGTTGNILLDPPLARRSSMPLTAYKSPGYRMKSCAADQIKCFFVDLPGTRTDVLSP